MRTLPLLLLAACASTPPPAPTAAPAATPAAEPAGEATPSQADRSAGDWVREGIAHRKAGRVDDAVAAYNRAIKLDPKQPDVWFNLGNVQLEAGRFADAREQYAQALVVRPDDADAKLNHGLALMGLNEYAAAAHAFQGLIDQISGREDAWLGLGAARHRLGDGAGAIEAFRRAHALAPGSPRARYNLGMQLSGGLLHRAAEAKAYDEALGLLEGYLAAPLDDPRTTNAKTRLQKLREAKQKLAR